MAKAVIWCRVSTDKQEFESQKSDLTKIATKKPYCFNKKDLIYIGKSGASAIKMNKLYQQEVDELIKTIDKTPDLSTVFVWEISRLARNKVAFQQMEQKLIESKIQLICMVPELQLLNDNKEVNDGMELTFDLLITLAKQEMDIKKKRFARGKKQKAKEGRFSGGKIPFGYRVNPDNDNLIEEDEKEKEIVKKIYDMYEDGYSQSKIAIELNEMGYANPRHKDGRIIQLGLISNILRNKCYTGQTIEEKLFKYKNKKENEEVTYTRYERKYPQIISIDQYNKCRDIAEANRTITGKGKNIYYASRLIKCQSCGCYWSASGAKINYHCYNAIIPTKKWAIDGRKNEQCKNRTSININVMDSLLWYFGKREEAYSIMKASKEQIESLNKKIAEYQKNIDEIPSQIESIDKIIENYAIKNSEGDISDKKYKEIKSEKLLAKQQLYEKKINLERKINELKKKIDDITNILQKYGISEKLTIEKALKSGAEYVKQYNRIYNSISDIRSEKERNEIVHKNIKMVHVKNVKLKYKYKIGWRDTIAKQITMWFDSFIDEQGKEAYERGYICYYLPFNGKGNGLFITMDYVEPQDDFITDDEDRFIMENIKYEWEKDYLDSSEAQFENDEAPHRVNIINIEYLNRYTDEGKHKRREKEKEIAYSAVKGYFRIEDIMNKTGDKYSHIYGLIKRGRLKATILKHKCFIHPEDAENYINERNYEKEDKVQL